jgi:hypothetical protein
MQLSANLSLCLAHTPLVMRVLFLVFLMFFSTSIVVGQHTFYQEGTLSFIEEEEEARLQLRYDPFFDVLYYPRPEGGEGVYRPAQLSEFSLAGARYYSISLAQGQPAFMKVLYEGKSFAVLQKELSASLIHYLCAEYPSSFSAEEQDQTGKLRLIYKSKNSLIADMAEELELESATFVVTPSGITLFQLHTPAALSSDDLDKPTPYQGLQMVQFKKLFSSQQQFAQAKKIIRGSDLKLISPESIADAFRQLDAQL